MSRMTRAALSASSLLGAAALVAFGMPAVTGLRWSTIGAGLARLAPLEVVGLTALWIAGLAAYTIVLTASLPGLTHVRAFVLNAVGSAVSNVVPFGGALGVAVTVAFTTRWRFTPTAIAASTLLTGIVNTLVKLALPAIGLGALAISGGVGGTAAGAVVTGSAATLVALLGVVAVLWSDRAGTVVGAVADRLARVLPRAWRPEPGRIGRLLAEVRRSTVGLARHAWPRLAGGALAYAALQATLFTACLAVTGTHLGPAATFAAFALGRLLTLVVVTPGGSGFAETGTTALLVTLGAPPPAAAAGVLLYSLFVFVLEIPLGALTWASWWVAGNRAHPSVRSQRHP